MTRRVPLRFGLRSLLLLMLLASVGLALWTRVVRPYSEQATAIAWLERRGAEVTSGPASGPAWRRAVVEAMAGQGSYREAIGVRLENVDLPDQGPDRLAALPWLVWLHLDRTDFDGDDARCLAGMNRLETLSVRYTGFDDRAAAVAARLPSLRLLRVTGTDVSDAGLATLAEAPKLEDLFARWSKTTVEGAEAFRLANAECRLHAHELPQ